MILYYIVLKIIKYLQLYNLILNFKEKFLLFIEKYFFLKSNQLLKRYFNIILLKFMKALVSMVVFQR